MASQQKSPNVVSCDHHTLSINSTETTGIVTGWQDSDKTYGECCMSESVTLGSVYQDSHPGTQMATLAVGRDIA